MIASAPKSLEFLLYFSLIFGPIAFGCVEPWSLAILQIALLLIPCLYFIQQVGFCDSPLYKSFFPAVLGLILIGMLQRYNPTPMGYPHVLGPFTLSLYDTKRALLLWCSYAALLWCGPQVLNSPDRLRRCAWVLFLLGVFVAVVGIMQGGQGNKAIYGLREVFQRDPFGPYYNRDHAASMMVMSMLIGCGIFFSRFAALRETRSMGKLSDMIATQMLVLFMIFVTFYGILKTGSRGGFHSLIFSAWISSFLAAGFLKRRRMILGLRAGLLLSVIGYLAFIYLHPAWIGISQGVWDESTAYRFSMYRSGWMLFGDFPVWGIGMGGFQSAFLAYQERFIKGIVEHIHSDWFEMLLQWGAIGLAFYAFGLAFFLWQALKVWKSSPLEEMRGVAGGFFAAAIAFILHGFVDFSFQIPANAVLFFVIITWLGSPVLETGSFAVKPAAFISGKSLQIISSAFCFLSIILIASSVRPAVASWYDYRGRDASLTERPYYIAKAIQWDQNPDYLYKMGATYFYLAENTPSAKIIFLSRALKYSSAALNMEPLNRRFKYLQGSILWRLGRGADGKILMSRIQ